jgi:NAD(P)-dependent dehydrogenase (short-subunit alcohol dehydrogenase family)
VTKHALVTGAGRGIGKVIAVELARAGFDVSVVDVEASSALLSVAADITALGQKSVALAGDVSNTASHESLLDRAETAIGPLTTLVNNAGVSVMSRGDLLDVTQESYDRCFSVNTRGTFFLTQAFSKRVLTTATQFHRSIVTVTSANATAVSIARGEYCMSKSAASMMSKLFATRLSDEGVGVYEIQPGFIETDMTAPSKAKYDALIAQGLTVVKRFGSTADVARVAVTLASGLLPYTVGQAIHVDGGLLTVRY